HDQLRARFWQDESGAWRQEVLAVEQAPEPVLLESLDVEAERDLGRDSMVRAGLVGERLVLDIHHLAGGGASWRVLLGGLERALAGESLARVGTSFREWAQLLGGRAPDAEPEWERTASLPVDFADGENRASGTETVSVELDEEETRLLLQRLPSVYRTQVNEV